MTKRIYENPVTEAGYVTALLAHNVELPVTPSGENMGVLLDASGRDFLTIDSGGDRPDEEVEALTALICMAINQIGGFKAIRATCGDEEPGRSSTEGGSL